MALKNVHKRVVVSIDLDYKDSHQFEDGTKIAMIRRVENFNQRYTQPVNGIVIAAEDIPEGAEILVGHNASHDTNRIFDATELSGKEEASNVKYFSIPIEDCFAWRERDGEWLPMPGFAFALRIFTPYKGIIQNIEPTLIKNVLWCRTGAYQNLAVHTLRACDYEIIFQESKTGRESRLIRCRPDGDDESQRDPEFICIDHAMTKKILNQELLVGLSKSDAKPLNKIQHA